MCAIANTLDHSSVWVNGVAVTDYKDNLVVSLRLYYLPKGCYIDLSEYQIIAETITIHAFYASMINGRS